MAAEGRFLDALKLIKQDNPFPAVCGAICNRRCEDACTRGLVDAPIAIDEIKKFIAAQELKEENRYVPLCEKDSGGMWDDEFKIAVIGAGPGGLVSAKHAIEAGFEVSVFEASDGLGGQWNTKAAHSGIWPGMRTNTSRAMTAFSDFPAPPSHDLHPLAEQVHEYLRSYSDAFGVTDRIRFNTPVRDLRPAWLVDGEPFDAVIVASGRFRAPVLPAVLGDFTGELLHAFEQGGAGLAAELHQFAGHYCFSFRTDSIFAVISFRSGISRFFSSRNFNSRAPP
jgi:hypothetical protein